MRREHVSMFLISSLVILVFAGGFFACGIGTTKIGEIVGHPRDFAGREVTVSGEVTEVFSLVVIKYFVLRDNSGEITVVTDRPLPAKGEKIKVKGVVKEAFSLGTQSTLVLVEESKK